MRDYSCCVRSSRLWPLARSTGQWQRHLNYAKPDRTVNMPWRHWTLAFSLSPLSLSLSLSLTLACLLVRSPCQWKRLNVFCFPRCTVVALSDSTVHISLPSASGPAHPGNLSLWSVLLCTEWSMYHSPLSPSLSLISPSLTLMNVFVQKPKPSCEQPHNERVCVPTAASPPLTALWEASTDSGIH